MTRSRITKVLLGVVAATAFLAFTPDSAEAGGRHYRRGHYRGSYPRHVYHGGYRGYYHGARFHYGHYPRVYRSYSYAYPAYSPAYYPAPTYYYPGCYSPSGFSVGFGYYDDDDDD